MAFSAVFWLKKKTWSVVSSDQIVGDKKVGSTTYVMHAKKPHETRLLRTSGGFSNRKPYLFWSVGMCS